MDAAEHPAPSKVPDSPAISRLGSIWRSGGPLLVARRSRQLVLRKLHEGLLERIFSNGEQHATRGTTSLNGLTIQSRNKLSGSFYDPTPRLVIRWILDALPIHKPAWNFVDIGTGRGRVILEAAQHPFRRVIGVEFAEELFDAAEENVASIPLGHIYAGRVGVAHADATEWTPPNGPVIFFLYNPFDARVLKRFLDNVLNDSVRAGRPMVFLYLNPERESIFEQDQRLNKVPLSDGLALRLGALSPYGLSIYQTPDATRDL